MNYYLELIKLIELMALDELILFQNKAYEIDYQLGLNVANKIRE